MSNILIIKHGSLGDLIQAQGAIKDIRNSFVDSKVLLLTSTAYIHFMSQCPYIDGVLSDKRKPRWNLLYLLKLKRLLLKYNFTHVFDLQNSSRTKFYRKFLLGKSVWSSTATTLEEGEKKKNFDKKPVLKRLEVQLNKSKIKKYTNNEYVLIFPFCSKKHSNKKWPFFFQLINKIKEHYKNKYPVLIAPGPDEIELAKKFNGKIVMNDNKAININQLITLIQKSKFIITNDTGPAHICSHLNKNGIVLFGSHKSPEQVSIGNSNFNILKAKKISDLSLDVVFKEVMKHLN